MGNSYIMPLTVGNIGVSGKVPIVIEKEMKLNCSFGPTKLSPGEKSQTEGYSRSIQGKQFILESKPTIFRCRHLAKLQSIIKQVTEHLPGPMGTSI